MNKIWARQALLPQGWAENVRVDINDDGTIGDVVLLTAVEQPSPEDSQVGILLPAPVNVHSHAFQRAMAGLTERRGPDPSDSFWTWRQLMFRFLNHLTPDHVEAITAFVQMEMLEAGFATNVEFHYLHHQPDGAFYDNLAEMAERVAGAADQTGIGLTLLPVHYQYGGCDQRPLGPGQIRFGTDIETYGDLWQKSKTALSSLPDDTRIGVAPHSLRAIAPPSIPKLVKIAADGPIHMHIAEQIAEVEEVKASWGKRPVEWLLRQVGVNQQWCLIHCTQMTTEEISGLAKTGAVAGLCPITESSLGDGIFEAVQWFGEGGRVAVGSDSNVRISLSEELRTLDHSQRLRDHSRAALATSQKSTGRRLFDEVCSGGAQAGGRNCGKIAAGSWADLMALDDQCIDLRGRNGDIALDCYIFAGGDNMISDVWAGGRHMVKEGRHKSRQAIVKRYMSAMKELGDAI